MATGPDFELDGSGAVLLNESGLVAARNASGNPFVWDPTGQVRPLSLLPEDSQSQLNGSEVMGINSRGQAVGFSGREEVREDDLESTTRAVVWDLDGNAHDLGVLSGEDSSIAVAINDRGQVIGGSGNRAVLWEPEGRMRELVGLPGAEWTGASAINARGQVVGSSGDRAVLWEPDGSLRDLGDIPEADTSSAIDINDAGQVLLGTSNRDGTWDFLWDPDTGLTDLGVDSSALALNDNGQVAGSTTGSDGQRRAFMWDPDTGMRILEVGGDMSVAVGLNDLGQVVGWRANRYNPEDADPEFTGSAFLWDPDRGLIDLGALWQGPSAALAINNRGDVVGWRDLNYNDPQTLIFWSTAD